MGGLVRPPIFFVCAMAPKRIQIDWDQFDKLCKILCTQKEIADWFECSVDTLERAVRREHKVSLSEYYARKSVEAKISLRRLQFQAAERGSGPMLIFLGKNILGQSDHPQELEADQTHLNMFVDGLLTAARRMYAKSTTSDTESEASPDDS